MRRWGVLVIAALLIVVVVPMVARLGHNASPGADSAEATVSIPTPWDAGRTQAVAMVLGLDWRQDEGVGTVGTGGTVGTVGTVGNYMLLVPTEKAAIYREFVDALRPDTPDGDARLIVRFRPDTGPETVQIFEQALGLRLVRHWERLASYEFAIPAAVDAYDLAEWIRLSPLVEWAEVNESVNVDA